MYNQLIDSVLQSISVACLESKLTIATAESVTSGAIQLLLCQGEQCTSYYQGGITVYNNEQKEKVLKISKHITAYNNAVTEDVAIAMAIAASKHFSADIGIGITGFAVKDNICDKAYAYIAICCEQVIVVKHRLKVRLKDKEQNQLCLGIKSLYLLAHFLNKVKVCA